VARGAEDGFQIACEGADLQAEIVAVYGALRTPKNDILIKSPHLH
jgi:hypothetical protein